MGGGLLTPSPFWIGGGGGGSVWLTLPLRIHFLVLLIFRKPSGPWVPLGEMAVIRPRPRGGHAPPAPSAREKRFVISGVSKAPDTRHLEPRMISGQMSDCNSFVSISAQNARNLFAQISPLLRFAKINARKRVSDDVFSSF